MKKLFVLFAFINFLLIQTAFAQNVTIYKENDKFGLANDTEKITDAIYTKLIKLKDESFICLYKNKFGIISKDGEMLVEPKYTTAQRFVGKYAKLGHKGKYLLFDETGDVILDDNYSNIMLLYGKMFLIKKNYKYGLATFDGDIILAPVADDIYMPKANVLKISIDGEWYEIVHNSKDVLELPQEFETLETDKKNFSITKVVENPVASAGYGMISASDYFIKVFSSISPAYETTIDELVLSHGADTANILIKSSWLVKFPVVYAKNYINNIKTPNNGPLSDIKANLKNKIN